MFIPDTLLNMIIYMINLVTVPEHSVVERVSTNFSDNPCIYRNVREINRIYDGVEAETKKPQTSFTLFKSHLRLCRE